MIAEQVDKRRGRQSDASDSYVALLTVTDDKGARGQLQKTAFIIPDSRAQPFHGLWYRSVRLSNLTCMSAWMGR